MYIRKKEDMHLITNQTGSMISKKKIEFPQRKNRVINGRTNYKQFHKLIYNANEWTTRLNDPSNEINVYPFE